jgi:riboflavin transporter FmnP
MKKNFLNNKTMAKIAILSAVAFVVMYVDFPIPIAPPFYKIDLSEVVVLIGGFALGPLAAVIIEALKILLHLLFKGTQTMFIGEMANFLIGVALVVPASIIYKKYKTRKSAIVSLLVGTISMCFFGVMLNYILILPAYINIAQFPEEAIIGMGQAIFPSINDMFSFVLYCVLPFNLIKAAIVSLITIVLYKHISPLLK